MVGGVSARIGHVESRVHALQRFLLAMLGSMVLGAACAFAAGLFQGSSDTPGRLIFGLVLGLITSPAFAYAMWYPPRLKKGIFIVGINILTAFIIGQVLGVGGAMFISGPAYLTICAAYGATGRSEALEHARALNVCPACNYSLAGNVSGVCPECGRPT